MGKQIEVIYHIKLFPKLRKNKKISKEAVQSEGNLLTEVNSTRPGEPDYKILKSVYEAMINFCLFRMLVMYLTQRKLEQTIQNRVIRRWFILIDLQVYNFLQISDQIFILIFSPILNQIDDIHIHFKSGWNALKDSFSKRFNWINFINEGFLKHLNRVFKPYNYVLYTIIHVWFNDRDVKQSDIELTNSVLLLLQLKFFIVSSLLHHVSQIILSPFYYITHINRVINDKLNGYIELNVEDIIVVLKESFYFLWLEFIFQISM